MELFFRFDFAAARYLPRLPDSHRCSRMHGHTFQVEFAIRGQPGADSGWLVDFDEVEASVAQLKGELDHHCLNELAGLENPTTEAVAAWLWRRLAALYPGLHRVTVQEHPSRGVSCFGD